MNDKIDNIIIGDDDNSSFGNGLDYMVERVITIPNTERDLVNTEITMSHFLIDDNPTQIEEINNSIPINTSHDPFVIMEHTQDTDIECTVNTNRDVTEQTQVTGIPLTVNTNPISNLNEPGKDNWHLSDVTYNDVKGGYGEIVSTKGVKWSK